MSEASAPKPAQVAPKAGTKTLAKGITVSLPLTHVPLALLLEVDGARAEAGADNSDSTKER